MNPFQSFLEDNYSFWNHRDKADRDPVCTLYSYDLPQERQIVGLISSALAFGRAEQIVIAVNSVLQKMKKPSEYLLNATLRDLQRDFKDFVYRYVKADEIIDFLWGIKKVLEKYQTIENLLTAKNSKETVFDCLERFYLEFNQIKQFPHKKNYLLVNPTKNSACKRMHLYFRWMVRKDSVDPGGFSNFQLKDLFIPLDTHMLNFANEIKVVQGKTANRKNCQELTKWFQKINSEDPVRYDFTITRILMGAEKDRKDFFVKLKYLLQNYKL